MASLTRRVAVAKVQTYATPPRFPSTVNQVPELGGDRPCSGSELPIANLVTGITVRTRKRI